MKYVKLFESFKNIEDICQEYNISNYTINQDGSVDVDGDVNLFNKRLIKLPLKFHKVTGKFTCSYNQLASLEGGPNYVGGSFKCDNNQLTSLKGGPKEVGGGFYCHNNQLISLKGSPNEVGSNFYCVNNELTTLEGGPKEIGGGFNCEGNPIYSLYNLFTDYKSYLYSLDYGYLRGTDIVKSRFQEALEEIGKEVPEKIEGYNYI